MAMQYVLVFVIKQLTVESDDDRYVDDDNSNERQEEQGEEAVDGVELFMSFARVWAVSYTLVELLREGSFGNVKHH